MCPGSKSTSEINNPKPSHVMSSETRVISFKAWWNTTWEPCVTDVAQSTCLGKARSSASNRRAQQDHR